jgi:putative restriction endonuclease
MADALDEYAERFRRLHTDRSASRWPATTCHRAPHKPLLVLSVLDLIDEGLIVENRIELTPELGETFARYWACVPSGRERSKIQYPFFHLRSEGFWHLEACPGQEAILEAIGTITSTSRLQVLVRFAYLDEALFQLLASRPHRDRLRGVLIQTYFDQETQERLIEQAMVNTRAFEYSRELLAGTEAGQVRELPPSYEVPPAVRDQGFRRAVVVAYERRCALCGIRILTLEGHTAVDAAHIIPWSVSRDDRPTNGMALCRLCHWAFDEGMVTVDGRYSVVTSPQLRRCPSDDPEGARAAGTRIDRIHSLVRPQQHSPQRQFQAALLPMPRPADW